jgi:hypothetical protein
MCSTFPRVVSPAEAVEMQRRGSSLHRTDESGFWHGSEAPRDGYLGMGVRLLEMVLGMGVRLLEMDTYYFTTTDTASADACVPLSPKVEFQHLDYFTPYFISLFLSLDC